MILMFFVDNIITTYCQKDQYRVDEFKQKLQAKYKVCELGEAKHFLSIQIVRDYSDYKLWLLQDSYINKIAKKFYIKLTNPSLDHIVAIDQALEYTIRTKYRAIQFDSKADFKRLFVTSSDLAFVDDPVTRYSSHRYAFLLYGRLIDWKAVKGKTVTLSSTEAELLAITLTAKEFV